MIFKNKVFKKIAITLTGGTLAQIITFLSIPFITRMYSPDVFGLMSNVNVTSMFLVPILTLSLPYSFILIKTDKKLISSVANNIVMSFFLGVFLVLILNILNYIFEKNIDYMTIFFSIILAMSLSVKSSLEFFAIKKQRFSIYSSVLISQALVIAALKLFFGDQSPTLESLVIATLAGTVILNVVSLKIFNINIKYFSIKKMLIDIRANKHLVYFRTPQNLMANFNMLIPVIFITYFYSAYDTGLYALARTAIMTPMNVIGKSISDVLYSYFSTLYLNNEKISIFLNKIFIIISILGVIPVIIIITYSDKLFPMVFGVDWINSSIYAKYIIIAIYFNFIAKPFVSLVPLFNLEKVFFINSIINTISITIGLFLGYYCYQDPTLSIAFSSFLSIFSQLIIIIISKKRVKIYEKK